MYDFKTVFSSNHLRFTQVSNRIWSSFPGSVSQSNLDFTGIICDRENWVPWRAFRDWMEKISAHLHTWAAEQLAKVAKGHKDDCHLAPQNPSVYLRHPHGLPRQKGNRWPHHSFAFQMPIPQTGVLTLVKAFPTTFKQLKKSLTRCPWRSNWYRYQHSGCRTTICSWQGHLQLSPDYPQLLHGVWCSPFMPTPVLPSTQVLSTCLKPGGTILSLFLAVGTFRKHIPCGTDLPSIHFCLHLSALLKYKTTCHTG